MHRFAACRRGGCWELREPNSEESQSEESQARSAEFRNLCNRFARFSARKWSKRNSSPLWFPKSAKRFGNARRPAGNSVSVSANLSTGIALPALAYQSPESATNRTTCVPPGVAATGEQLARRNLMRVMRSQPNAPLKLISARSSPSRAVAAEGRPVLNAAWAAKRESSRGPGSISPLQHPFSQHLHERLFHGPYAGLMIAPNLINESSPKSVTAPVEQLASRAARLRPARSRLPSVPQKLASRAFHDRFCRAKSCLPPAPPIELPHQAAPVASRGAVALRLTAPGNFYGLSTGKLAPRLL
jgi:hypothetical protein